jgi:prevent-host-death family protein
MRQVNVHEAKTHLSKLLEAVEGGDEVVIARAGKPVARLVSHRPAKQPRKPGSAKGKIWMADDFDAPDEQIERDFGLRD